MHLEMPQALFCRALRGWKGLRISGLGFRVYLWFGVSGMERSSSGGLGFREGKGPARFLSCFVLVLVLPSGSCTVRLLTCFVSLF